MNQPINENIPLRRKEVPAVIGSGTVTPTVVRPTAIDAYVDGSSRLNLLINLANIKNLN